MPLFLNGLAGVLATLVGVYTQHKGGVVFSGSDGDGGGRGFDGCVGGVAWGV